MNAFRKSIPSKKRANIGASRNARSNIGGREEKPLARHCESGAPERSRTSNRLIRSQILYPVELRVHLFVACTGFEPVIFALRGRCPGPLDEHARYYCFHNLWAL